MFCCSRLSEAVVQGQISRGPKDFGSCPDGVWDFSHLGLKARFREAQQIVVVDSKGNVKEFFGSGFGRFRLVSYRWCLGLFASTATACVLLFEAFGSGVLGLVLLFEAFGSGVLRPDFAIIGF